MAVYCPHFRYISQTEILMAKFSIYCPISTFNGQTHHAPDSDIESGAFFGKVRNSKGIRGSKKKVVRMSENSFEGG